MNNKFETIECNLCSHIESKLLHQDEYFTYEICKSCGHVYQSNRKSQEFYINLPYKVAQKLVDEVDINVYDNHVRNRGNYIYDFIKNDIDVKNHKNLLDIGSGYGGVSYYLNDHLKFKTVVGVTPDYDEKNNSKFYKNINFIQSTYQTPIDGKFDVVILVHTLEHFINPINALLNIKTNLSKNGILYVEVPNFFWEEIIVSPIYTNVHLSYFSKKSLINLLKYCGFKIIKVKESKYWGNIKVIACHDDEYENISNKKQFFKKNGETWFFKLFKLNFYKLFSYPIVRMIKKYFRIKPND